MNSSNESSLLFVRSLLANPLKVGAVAPSSPGLSRLMASRVDHSEHPILEIGAGTGVITREILDLGVLPERLFLIERDPTMADFLRERYPRVRVRCGDALHAALLLGAEELGRPKTVISSLPLRNFPAPEKEQIVQAMMDTLTPDGQLIQFTYAAGCPISAKKLGLKAECLGRVWRNLPPAAVWRFTFTGAF